MEFMDGMGNIVFESIAKSTGAYLYATEGVSNITRWSQNAVDNFDLPGEYVCDNDTVWSALVHPEDLHILSDDLDKVFSGKKVYHHCEYRVRKRSGVYVWVRCRGYATRGEDGRLLWFIGLVRELASLNKVDYTTRLLSIYEFRRNLEVLMDSGSRDGGILLLGVDNFRKINTMYSYSVGDQVLLEAALALQDICPPNVTLYRIEGDKFAFVCPHYTVRDISLLFQDAIEGMKNLELGDGERVNLSASGGAMMLDCRYEGVDEMHRDLEHALSVSKQKSKGALTFFSKELLEQSLRELRLREELRKSVQNNFEGFELFYQPIMKGGTGELYSCEALLRWHNDKFPDTYPDKFIPILEETGLIKQVGKWVARSAVQRVKEWRRILPQLKVNINISYVQILEGGLEEYIVELLKEADMPPESLIVEITESCDIKDMEAAVRFVEELRRNKIEVALDDFGTGYSSIRLLQQIPADWIKLDHNFVSKIKDNQFDRNIVQYLVNLCHSLGYKVCVEGIEDEMCRNLVTAQNVEAEQGYYYSRPVPAKKFYNMYLV